MANKTLFEISPDEISPNPHNPRLIFDYESMDELKRSIEEVGILVPITVYQNRKEIPKTKYILLDGERRWRVVKELNIPTIPANVIDEPRDVTQNILYMFNIHHYRKEWELFPTALKLEVIINSLKSDNEAILSKFTGVSRSTIRRCKVLLWFPHKYRETLMDRRGKISTDFFIEIHPITLRLSEEPEFSYPKGIEPVVDSLIDIFIEGKVITDVKEFRDIRKSMGYYDSYGRFQEFKEQFINFLREPNIRLDVFASPEIESDQARRNILRYIGYLNANLKDINPNLLSDVSIVEQLEALRNYIDEILISIEY